MKRSTTSVPASLSISYLIGSPPTGTSMMTLTSRGGSIPIETASMRMDGSAGARVELVLKLSANRARQRLVRPGEGDFVERFRPELFGRARHHAAAERAIEFGGGVVVGQRPDHHALQPALPEVALGGREQAAAETKPLELGPQVKLVDLALEMQAARAVAAVIRVAGDLV